MSEILARFFWWGVIVAMLLLAKPAAAATLYIPAMNAAGGESLTIPIKIDSVDNLAGIKLVLTYDQALLTFVAVKKTAHTSPLMHVVNDKQPGKLIIVMAGAEGIKGSDFPLLNLKFHIKKDVEKRQQTKINITEVQLMSDKLKTLESTIDIHPITLSPRLGKDK